MKKTTLTDAEWIEKALREKIDITGLKLTENSWVINEIEILLNCYPILRKFNHKSMSLRELQALVQRLSEYLGIEYSEDDDLIFVDLTATKTFFSLSEMLILMILALLRDKSHVHFKYSEELFNDTKVSEASAIDYLCDNSYFIKNTAKNVYHFTLSAFAILSFDYNKQDKIVNTLVTLQQLYKKDLSLNDYVYYRKTGQNIDISPKLKNQSKSIKIIL
jgi:hypothetical protein